MDNSIAVKGSEWIVIDSKATQEWLKYHSAEGLRIGDTLTVVEIRGETGEFGILVDNPREGRRHGVNIKMLAPSILSKAVDL